MYSPAAVIGVLMGTVQVAAAFSTHHRHDNTILWSPPNHPTPSRDNAWQKQRGWWSVSLHASAAANTRSTSSKAAVLQVNDLVGSGSYGCVHLCSLGEDNDNNNNDTMQGIGKRSWTLEDLSKKIKTEEEDDKNRKEKIQKIDSSSRSIGTAQRGSLTELANRCRYYWRVEQHCFKKLPPHDQIPLYQGTYPDVNGRDWLLFNVITDCHGQKPAPSLLDLMKRALADDPFGTDTEHHHLHVIEQALGLENSEMGETLDIVMESLLQVLSFVHSHQIVHRDIKPGNILVTTRKLVLLDFGSAADLEPISRGILKTRIGMEDGSRVAISPIYAAPEVFIDIHRAPTAFDVFSGALLFCQLLFHYFDERTDAGFHQQLREVNYNLDDWLRQEISSKVRPSGLEDALDYLGERPGLWRLLGDMMRRDPTTRPLSSQALERFRQIVSADDKRDDDTLALLLEADGPFFKSVIESMENCLTTDLLVSRPLHFVATMRRSLPLGLVLSEAMYSGKDSEEKEEWSNSADHAKWKRATAEASPGQVFIKEIIPGGQADELGIFEIGDELQGVGELPLLNGGFERVVEMLQQQPRAAKFVTLHFARLSTTRSSPTSISTPSFPDGFARSIQIVSQGAWSSKGKRETQEDSFVLHEIHDSTDRSVLLAGVMDGHAGTAAATLVAEMMPNLLSEQLFLSSDAPLADALAKAWDITCQSYRQSCQDEADSCEAIYDPREGKLFASTGSERWPAGTTTNLIAVDEGTGEVCVLNCGDSRSLVISGNGTLVFSSMDHKPEVEMERFRQGQALGYSTPTCRMSRWQLKVGEYVYAVSRSLEGQFATSKGIVSDPDITTLQVQGADTIVVVATDGLWEVMDSQEVTRDVTRMKQRGLSAANAAKNLCAMAIEKGSLDNVSVVVVYLE